MSQPAARLGRLKSDDGSGTFNGMETRVALLEKSFEKMDVKLDTVVQDIAGLRGDIAYLKGKVDTLPSAMAFGELSAKVDSLPSAQAWGQLVGRVESLPTTGKLASMLAIAVGSIAVINNWPAIIAAVF
ncbi:hypothetical protein [Phyllobacterium sp. SB3]|uniref:hypothetical protein n=1 Tax=Phyllobacterium sp. SB3 TaxID=3156073 RepID=UPI0032AFB233